MGLERPSFDPSPIHIYSGTSDSLATIFMSMTAIHMTKKLIFAMHLSLCLGVVCKGNWFMFTFSFLPSVVHSSIGRAWWGWEAAPDNGLTADQTDVGLASTCSGENITYYPINNQYSSSQASARIIKTEEGLFLLRWGYDKVAKRRARSYLHSSWVT